MYRTKKIPVGQIAIDAFVMVRSDEKNFTVAANSPKLADATGSPLCRQMALLMQDFILSYEQKLKTGLHVESFIIVYDSVGQEYIMKITWKEHGLDIGARELYQLADKLIFQTNAEFFAWHIQNRPIIEQAVRKVSDSDNKTD